MASLLRSGKFFRFFSNFTRSLELNNGGRNNNESLVCARRGEWEIKIHRSLSAAHLPLKNLNDAPSQQSTINTDGSSIDRAIEKVEVDAKKLGRISREDILNIIQQIKKSNFATTTQSLLLIRCCGNLVPEETLNSRTKLVSEIWKMFEAIGVPLDISHYNALLRVYLENEHNFNPMKFLETMEQKNVQPNRVTYQRLMSAYCQKGDIEGASQILEIMKTKDLPIGELVFNSLVMGHANTGDLESAKGVIKVMSQAGLEPDSETYRSLLCGYAKHGLLQELNDTLSECRSKDIVLHDRDLLEVLYSASVNGHSAIVDTLMSRMKKNSGFNQDCVNVVLRLVNRKKEDDAFKVLLDMKPVILTDRQASATGNFFIRQIVKANCSTEKIVSFCQRLVDSGLNNRAYFRALEAANSFGKTEISNAVLKQIQKQKDSLRPHAFWPLLNSQFKVNGEKGVLDALRQMAAVQVVPNVDTINQHVLPHMAGDNVESILRKLRSADVPAGIVALSLVVQCLNRLDFTSAIDVASKIYFRFDNVLFHRAAADAYLKSKDASSTVQLLHSMLRQPNQLQPAAVSESDPKDQAAELAGPVLKEIFSRAPKPKLELIEPLLKAMHQSGIGISQSVAQQIQESAGEEMTESVAQLLVELGSGKLAPTDLIPYPTFANRNVFRRTQKFVDLVKDRKLEEALQEKANLESQNVVFTDGLNIQLMDLYAHHERFDEALAIFKKLYANNPELVVTPFKLISLATSLLKGDHIEDAFLVLNHLKTPTEKPDQSNNSLELACWRLLNACSSKGDIDLTKKVFEVLEKAQFKITGLLASPLVKVHLTKDDVDSALNTFINFVEKYRITPLKSALTAKLIELEDAQRLQQVMDASIKVHGEMNSLYDLVFSFLECGRVRQAKKVLETPGLRARSQRIETVCKRYMEEKRITELENLIKITKDVYGIDRSMMYSYLLTAYIREDDVARATSLWTQMQEEDVKPTDEFLHQLGKFLEEKNEPVPFVIPAVQKVSTSSNNPPTPKATESSATSTPSNTTAPKLSSSANKKEAPETNSPEKVKFIAAIKSGDLDGALESKKQMESQGESVTIRNKSDLIEASVKAGRLNIAHQLVLDLLKSGGYPLPRIFRYYMKNLAAAGDHESIRDIGQYLSTERKSLLSYENVLAAAVAHDPNHAAVYVDTLLNEIKSTSFENNREEQIQALRIKFPRGGILGILEKNPDLLPKCQEIANEYVNLQVYAPLNSLWCHYLNIGDIASAQSSWEILKTSPIAIGFQPVCRHLRQHGNSALAETLIGMLRSSPTVKPSALGVAYSAWVDVHRVKNDLDTAIATLNKAVSGGVELSLINESTLSTLKAECEKAGKEFPFSIPKTSVKLATQSEAD